MFSVPGSPAATLALGFLLVSMFFAAPSPAQGPGTPEMTAAEPPATDAAASGTAGAVSASVYALTDLFEQDDGARVRLDHWAGRPVLMAMAYSSCRETCSYTVHRLEELERAATLRGQPIEIVIVSYDPRVDDAAVWSGYRRRHGLHDPHWHFLVGSDKATRAFASLLGLRFWNYDEHVMHEFGITLVDPSGHISRVLHWTNRNENLLAASSP